MENETSRPLRVLHVHGDLIAGGGQTLSREWLTAVDRTLIDPCVVVLSNPVTLEDSFERNQIPVTKIFGNRLTQIINLARFIRINNIDVVHTQSEPDRKVGHVAALITRRPVIAHLHSEWVYFKPQKRNGLLSTLKGMFTLYLRKLSDRAVVHFVATSDFVKDSFAPHTKIPVTAIEPGVQIIKFDADFKSKARKNLGIPEGTAFIVNTSRLSSAKNIEDFIEVLKRLSQEMDVVGHVYGEGEEAENLNNKISELGVEDIVKILPPISDLSEVYAAADIYLATSIDESFGISVLESLACGLPVVAYDLVPYRRYADSYIAVEVKDIDGLTKSCIRVLSDETLKTKLVEKGILAAREYDIQNGTRKLSELDRKYAKSK